MDTLKAFSDRFIGVTDFAGVGVLVLVVAFVLFVKGWKAALMVCALLIVMMSIANLAV
jgi:hypothetical protein|tara:strand:+ start:159 stop:332 length:174 start_codon:yes stop_codon:yes gene_type:complete